MTAGQTATFRGQPVKIVHPFTADDGERRAFVKYLGREHKAFHVAMAEINRDTNRSEWARLTTNGRIGR